MKRRAFIERTIAAGAAGLLSACSRPSEPDPNSTDRSRRAVSAAPLTLRMHFTGLLLFEIWTNIEKKMLVSFVNAAKAHVHEPHVALMMLKLTGDPNVLKWPEEYPARKPGEGDDALPLHEPQIVRVGSEVYGLWGLGDKMVWVKSPDVSDFNQDRKSSFSFPSNVGPWKGLDEFFNLGDVVGGSPVLKHEFLTSQVAITRGSASGLEPITKCERDRLYAIKKGTQLQSESRKYAAEFIVSQEIPSSEVVLGVRTRPQSGTSIKKHSIVTLRGVPGAVIDLSFMNVPTQQFSKMSHFTAYSEAIGVAEAPIDLVARDANECLTAISPWAAPPAVVAMAHPDVFDADKLPTAAPPVGLTTDMIVTGNQKRNPPRASCVPAYIVRG